MACYNQSEHLENLPGHEIYDRLIAFHRTEGVNIESALIRASISIGVHPNTIRNWRDGVTSPCDKSRRALRSWRQVNEFFEAVS